MEDTIEEYSSLLDECVSSPRFLASLPFSFPLALFTSFLLFLTSPPLGWFTSLSRTFLSSRTARLLILAGTDRLDQELMIGQMQGKFQLEVIQGVGHMVQEDDPRRLAELVVGFWRRNERLVVGIKGVKKVGEV